MSNVLTSIDNCLNSAATNGLFRRAISDKIGATTSATANSGGISLGRFPNPLTIPSLGAGVTGVLFGNVKINGTGTGTYIAAIEFLLGTLTVSGNSFASSGVTMPTRSCNEATAAQTASLFTVIVATTALAASSPVVTITYTNQAGTGSKTCTLTLPTSPVVNTGFLLNPLASGDSGVQAVTNMSISTGASGVLKAYGYLPIGMALSSAVKSFFFDPLACSFPIYPAIANDVISIYRSAATAASDVHAFFTGVGEN